MVRKLIWLVAAAVAAAALTASSSGATGGTSREVRVAPSFARAAGGNASAIKNTRQAYSHAKRRAEAASLRPAAVEIEAIFDGSSSVPKRYTRASIKAFASAVAAWPRPLPAGGGSRAQAPLNVLVRLVSGTSYSPESLAGTWRIRGVPGVQALPTRVTGDFTYRVIRYQRQRATATRAYRAARVEAQRAARAIAAIRPKRVFCSDIAGAVSAAAQSYSTSGPRLLFIASDFAQYCKAQIAGSLRRVDILAVHLCWQAGVCKAQERTWERRFGAAHTTRFVRFERMNEALRRFLKEV